MTNVEKKCVIVLDKIKILKTIEYNNVLNEIKSFEDIGSLS